MTYLLVCALVDRIMYDIFVECVIMEFMVLLVLVMGLCKEKFQKSEITMEVGGWVQVSLAIFLFVENHPKIALNQY